MKFSVLVGLSTRPNRGAAARTTAVSARLIVKDAKMTIKLRGIIRDLTSGQCSPLSRPSRPFGLSGDRTAVLFDSAELLPFDPAGRSPSRCWYRYA